LSLGLDLDRLAGLVHRAHVDPFRAHHVVPDAGDREAALLALLLALAEDDHRVHERVRRPRRVLLRHVDHEDALEHADLVRGETDAVVGLHRLAHVGREVGERRVELGDLLRAGLQHGIPVVADASQAHFTSPASTWVMEPFTNSTFTSPAIFRTALASSTPTTVPMMPPVVTTRSPFFSSFSIWSVFFFCCCCGRMSSR